ncbi:MAG: hypothetical protein OIF36_05135 [Alphaproteobacteria bacterium]|nr:hypothetical protein [Alphaproteobacteria bacterium]
MSRKRHNKKTGLGKIIDANRIDEILTEENKKHAEDIHIKHTESKNTSDEKPEY